jgi:hypothetical protein
LLAIRNEEADGERVVKGFYSTKFGIVETRGCVREKDMEMRVLVICDMLHFY